MMFAIVARLDQTDLLEFTNRADILLEIIEGLN